MAVFKFFPEEIYYYVIQWLDNGIIGTSITFDIAEIYIE